MRLINGVPTDLEAKDGETISLLINKVRCPPNVNLSLDGSPWSGGSFPVLKTAHPNGRHLLVQINCGPVAAGAEFEVVLTGDVTIDPGNQPSTFKLACRQGPVRQLAYSIDVV
jgi:hypothetical protein